MVTLGLRQKHKLVITIVLIYNEVMKNKKLDLRGGERHTLKRTQGQALLIQYLWEKFGGVTEVSKLLRVHQQAPLNWKLRGKVPLHLVGHVSRKLKVPRLGLNYEDVVLYEGKGVPWEDIVKGIGFDARTTNHILNSIHPKSIKEILI